jgi:hypothetical protein
MTRKPFKPTRLANALQAASLLVIAGGLWHPDQRQHTSTGRCRESRGSVPSTALRIAVRERREIQDENHVAHGTVMLEHM